MVYSITRVTKTFLFFSAYIFFFSLSTMGARFSEMQDDGREVLAGELCEVLQKLLKPTATSSVFMIHGLRAAVIISNVLLSAHSGHYNDEGLFNENPSLEGLGNVVLQVQFEVREELIDLFDDERIVRQIITEIHRLWMIFLINNIITDQDATDLCVERCRMMLAREIVRRVCDGTIAYERTALPN